MARIPSRGSDQFIVRFPDGMRDRIARLAEENGRSMNSEIIQRLQDSFQADEAVYAALAEMRAEVAAIDQTVRDTLAKFEASIATTQPKVRRPRKKP